ncbi:hypothetical protein KAU40_01020 [Candidatus Parcubacteria bacterium]|nr:hypothetical protein [Candidatus Parcubacteria bacterium]
MLKESLIKTLNGFKQVLPIILGVIMLVSLSITIIPKSFYESIFTGNKIIDPLFGAIIGSAATGNPITSYIIGGELLAQGVSLLAVTAFILAWVSVGLVQLPAESLMLGKRFAITRNVVSFITALIVAILTIFTLSLLC